jgi:hypothetical protein
VKKITKLSDLTPDSRNANRGTKRGHALLGKSLQRHGAGRSILADKNGKVVAGNKTVEEWAAMGGEIQVVPSDGKKLIVVQRTDVDLDTKQGREMAIADNQVGHVGLEWDGTVLNELLAEGVELKEFFQPQELLKIKGVDPQLVERNDIPGGAGDQTEELGEGFVVVVKCPDEKTQAALIEELQARGLDVRAVSY